MNARLLILTAVSALTATCVALSNPGAAKALTESNPSAPDLVPSYVLGENAGPSGASLDFGGTTANRLNWTSATQVVTITNRVYRRTATSWVYVTMRTWTVTLPAGYHFTSPNVNVPVAQLNAYGYGATVEVDWKTTTGVLLTKDVVDYNANADYRCWNPYPNCLVANNNDGLGAYLIFPPIFF